MVNSHFVPRFILKNFSSKLCLYDIRTGMFQENIPLENAYSQLGFYDEKTEKKLSRKLESQFANLLNDKILTDEKIISLKRSELWLVKKFLLVSVIRSMGSEALMQKEKRFYDDLKEKFIKMGLDDKEAEEATRRPFIEKEIENESEYDYWMRTINVILDTDGSPEKILKHPDKTYPAHRWAEVIAAGYIAFWDSDFKRDEFVITDIGMTSENEKGWDGITNHNLKKNLFLQECLKNEKDEGMKKLIGHLIWRTCSFNENFEMFPISAKRMIVEIAPFFKFRQSYKNIYKMPALSELTELVNEELYYPNSNHYVEEQTNPLELKYNKDDEYIYYVKQLTRDETRYCNALFLDRINSTLGFSSLNKAVGSILTYKKLHSYPYIPRINYDTLYKIIEQRFN